MQYKKKKKQINCWYFDENGNINSSFAIAIWFSSFYLSSVFSIQRWTRRNCLKRNGSSLWKKILLFKWQTNFSSLKQKNDKIIGTKREKKNKSSQRKISKKVYSEFAINQCHWRLTLFYIQSTWFCCQS